MSAITNGVRITLDSDPSVSLHSINDLHFAIGNNNYIGEPELETNYLNIPGRNGYIDFSEAVSGHPVYKSRIINILFGAEEAAMNWDAALSSFRNIFDGKRVRLTFDNDPEWYWIGRARVIEFDRTQNLGQFTFSVFADPFKYFLQSTDEYDWLWDPFNFNTGIIEQYRNLRVQGTASITVPVSDAPVTPEIIATNMVVRIKVNYNGQEVLLDNGTNYFPQLRLVPGLDSYTLQGIGNVTIKYRKGSL